MKKWTKFNLVFDQFLVYFAVAVFKLKKVGNESLKPSKIGGIKAVSVTWKHTHLSFGRLIENYFPSDVCFPVPIQSGQTANDSSC